LLLEKSKFFFWAQYNCEYRNTENEFTVRDLDKI
jgi:hypothetical protein